MGIEEIEKEAKKCHYLYIYVPSRLIFTSSSLHLTSPHLSFFILTNLAVQVSNDNCWFERCAHNVALGILRADKKTVVIHAISDSD